MGVKQPDPQPGTPAFEAVLRKEFERISASASFARSPVLLKLLRYLVEEAVAGRGDALKAYSIAVDGLGKGEDFDPQSDSYPRVQVGRLRKMLNLFYAEYGAIPGTGNLRLVIALGGYSVRLGELEGAAETRAQTQNAVPMDDVVQTSRSDDHRENGPAAAVHTRSGAKWALAAVIALAILAAMAVLIWKPAGWPFDRPEHPGVETSLILEPVSGDETDSLNLRVAFGMEGALIRFGRLNISRGTLQEAGGRPDTYVLKIASVGAGSERTAQMRLVSASDGQTVWSREIDYRGEQSELRREIERSASALAQRFGVIETDQFRKLNGSFAVGRDCLLQFDAYRLRQSENMRKKVQHCLEQSVRKFPSNSNILQAASFFSLLEAQRVGSESLERQAIQFARRAYLADMANAGANLELARTSYFYQNCEQGRIYGDRAMELNPIEPTALTAMGFYIAGCGDLKTAEALFLRSQELDLGTRAFNELGLTLIYSRDGRGGEAIAMAKKMPLQGPSGIVALTKLATAMAVAADGDTVRARKIWKEAAKAATGEARSSPTEVISALPVPQQVGQFILNAAERSGVVGKTTR